jgi:hypothetical protein
MINFYKSFIDDESDSSDEEQKEQYLPVDLKERTFKEVQGLDGTIYDLNSDAPHYTNVSDALFALFTGVRDEAPDQLEKILP